MESSIPSQDAWTRAKERYVEDLTDEEKRLYYQATPETLFYDASAAQKKYTSGSTTFHVVEKLQPLRDAIDQYGQALDVYSNAYPLALSPLWGSIRVLLHIAGEFGKYFEKLVDMFERIGDVLPRFRVYEKLFSSHERLVQALSVAYLDVLIFCSKCKAVFRHGQRSSKTSLKIAFKLTWKPFERQFGQQIQSFREHRKTVEKEAGLSHMIEAADSRAVVLANQMQLQQQREEDHRQRIIAMIPSVDTETKHTKLQGLRYEGTGRWLLQKDKYLDWSRVGASSYLCCHGIPGCGKTVLASMIIDDLLSKSDTNNMKVVYYYCDYTDQRTLQTNRILGTMLRQFIKAGRFPDEIEPKILEAYDRAHQLPGISEVMEFISQSASLNPTAFVLDGLDECEKDTRKEMLALIERLMRCTTSAIKIFVSCRDEDETLRSMPVFTRIQVTPISLESDIESFVEGSVRSRIISGELKIRNPGLEQEIVSELASKAHGMFLWVFFQLNELCEAISDAKIRATLKDLPIGLVDTYERILEKIRTGAAKAEIALKVFKWIACAKRPLHVDELSEAVAFDTSDEYWDAEKLPDEDFMIESCKGLIVRDHSDKTVRFAHHTVRQFLTSRPDTKEEVSLEEVPLTFRLDHAQSFVAQICITYLSFSDFETQIVPWKPRESLEPSSRLQPGAPTYIPDVLGAGKTVFGIAYKLLGGKPDIKPRPLDFTTYVKPKVKIENHLKSEFADKHRLLQYIIDYWVMHTRSFGWGLEERHIFHKFHDLVQNRGLPFEFRPWGPNQHYGPYGCVSCPGKSSNLHFMSLFHYAAEIGHWPLMEPLVEDYCAHESHTDETLLIACRNGQEEVVRQLLKFDKFFNKSDKQALNIAACLGHTKVFEYLLGYHDKMRTFDLDWYVEPLVLAATNGHEEVVDLLCKRKSIVDCKDEHTGRTALCVAAAMGHDRVVQCLLRHGAAIHDAGHGEDSALYCAVEHGHALIVRVLLQCVERRFDAEIRDGTFDLRGYINSTTSNGKTLLHLAVLNGHAQVVEVLVEYGLDSTKGIFDYSPGRGNGVLSAHFLNGCTAMHLAAVNGDVNLLKALREGVLHMDSYTTSPMCYTPLQLAALQGHESAVRWLVANGAKFNRTSMTKHVWGLTALELAVQVGHGSVVSALVDLGAEVGNALKIAVTHRQEEILQKLLEVAAPRLNQDQINAALIELDELQWFSNEWRCYIQLRHLLLEVLATKMLEGGGSSKELIGTAL